MNIESGSSLGTFLTCPRKYDYRYNKLLDTTGYDKALGLGSFVHAFVEESSGIGRSDAGDQERRSYLERMSKDFHDAIKHDFMLAKEMVDLWETYWGNIEHPFASKHFDWIESEMEWVIPVTEMKKSHAGKSDGVWRHREWGKLFLYELKTATARDQESYISRLEIDRQISTNIIACKAKGYDIDGVIYDVIWKPGIKPLKANKKRAQDEMREEFNARFIATMAAEPNEHFTRTIVYRNKRNIDEHIKDLDGQFRALDMARETNNFYRNTSACDDYGRLCPFFSLCMSGETELESLYKIRDRKLPELSKEIQDGYSKDD